MKNIYALASKLPKCRVFSFAPEEIKYALASLRTWYPNVPETEQWILISIILTWVFAFSILLILLYPLQVSFALSLPLAFILGLLAFIWILTNPLRDKEHQEFILLKDTALALMELTYTIDSVKSPIIALYLVSHDIHSPIGKEFSKLFISALHGTPIHKELLKLSSKLPHSILKFELELLANNLKENKGIPEGMILALEQALDKLLSWLATQKEINMAMTITVVVFLPIIAGLFMGILGVSSYFQIFVLPLLLILSKFVLEAAFKGGNPKNEQI